MAKFSLARQPYYLAVIVFMCASAFECYVGNTVSFGLVSDLFLAGLVVSILLAGMSLVYLRITEAGGDDDSDAEFAGLPVGKSAYYGAVLALCAWRAIAGYHLNHNYTGITSTYGILWVLSALAIAVLTFANYRSFAAKRIATRGPASY